MPVRETLQSTLRPLSRLLAAAILAGLALPAAAQSGPRSLFVLTDDNRLAVANTATLDKPLLPSAINGLVAGDTLVAIDVRPSNGRLYGIATRARGALQLYQIDVAGAAPRATAIGTTGSFVGADGTTPAPITGSAFGIDFNPTVDRLRIVTSAGENFRINPNTGAFIDGDLGLAPGSVPGLNRDADLNGAANQADATAYTNNVVNATATTQYSLDSVTNALCIQQPPNAGVLVSPLPVTLGGAPLDFGAATGLDIAPGVDVATSGSAASGSAFAALNVDGASALFEIALGSGVATRVGGLTGANVRDIALAEPIPAGLALAASGTPLLRFRLDRPQEAVTVNVTGIVAGESLVGIDARPAGAQVFGLGINPAADTGTLYRIDPQTGAASAIGTPGAIAFDDGLGTAVDFAAGASWGIDFNPVVDRLRVVNDSGLNFRVNPDTGEPIDGELGGPPGTALPGINTDAPINGGAGTGPGGTAYTNDFPGATATTQYTLEHTSDSLYIQNPPNSGTQLNPQPVTLGGSPLDFGPRIGFDFAPDVTVATSGSAASGTGYATLTVGGTTSLYRVDVGSGVAARIGTLGTGGTAADGLIAWLPQRAGLFASATAPRALLLLLPNSQLARLDARGLASAQPVVGIASGETLVAIDVRPSNGRLYGLAHNAAAGSATLYHIDVFGPAPRATAVGPSGQFVGADGTTPVPITGTAFGIDFNPTVDRLRIVNNAGQNFRIDPNSGAFIDGNLGGAAGSVPGVNMDAALNGGGTGAAATAYTNSSVNANATTQYAIDTATDQLHIVNPPNAGTLTGGVPLTLGQLAFDAQGEAGLDIPSEVTVAMSGSPASGQGFALLTAAGAQALYRIELGTGALTTVAEFTGTVAVLDVAVAETPPAALALSASGTQLARFALATPGTGVNVTPTGVAAGERLVGIDGRPTTGQLFALGIDAAANTGTLYRLDPQTGAATAIGASGSIAYVDGSGAPVDFGPGSYGVDFNPTVDRIRVVSDTGLNFRINPVTGAPVDGDLGGAAGSVAGVNPDAAISGGVGPGLGGTAYVNNFAAASVTTQYTIDGAADRLYIQNPPNGGVQTFPVPLSALGGGDIDSVVGFDIPPGVTVATANARARGDGFAALGIGGSVRLNRVDLTTGVARSIGTLGAGMTPTEGLVVWTAPIDLVLQDGFED